MTKKIHRNQYRTIYELVRIGYSSTKVPVLSVEQDISVHNLIIYVGQCTYLCTYFWLYLFILCACSCFIKIPNMLNCELFAVYVLCLTTLWVYLGRSWDFHTLALAMFFPALFAFYFANKGFLTVVFGKNQVCDIVVPLSVLVCGWSSCKECFFFCQKVSDSLVKLYKKNSDIHKANSYPKRLNPFNTSVCSFQWLQWRIQEERQPLKGGRPTIWPFPPENCMKMNKFWPGGGGGVPCAR